MDRVYDYEIAFVVDAGINPDEITQLREQLSALAKGQGATVGETTQWDRRRLAYPLGGKQEGIHIFMNMKASPQVVEEVVRSLKMTESVLRHLVIRKDG